MTQTDTRIGGRALALLAVAMTVGGLGFAPMMAQQPSTTSVFTKAQADAGRATYKTSCASCHTPDLGGTAEYPQLAGDDFMSAWRTRPVKELYEFIQGTMPPEGPMLSGEETLGIVALILQENGATPGTTALTAATAGTIGSVATGKRPGDRLHR
jgi:mono/diheme cytochrome c family protein